MYYLNLLLVFILLIITICFHKKKLNDVQLWIKVFITYLSGFISYNNSNIHIPIGIIISYFIILRWSKKNSALLKLTLSFSLIGFIFANYVSPPIEIKNLHYTKNIHEQLNKFKNVESLRVYSKDDKIQKNLKQYLNNDLDQPYTMLLTYALLDQGIKIKNQEWLNFSAESELGIRGSKIKTEKKSDVICIELNNTDYIGLFSKNNHSFILKFVISGSLLDKVNI